MPERLRGLTLAIAVLALGACATYQPPALTATHPAHQEAPSAREVPPSKTLAYTQAEVEALRAAAPAPGHGDHRAPGAAPKTVVGEGEVVGTTPASGQIVIEHGEIKGFMDAMTMGYRTEPTSLLTTVKPGDKVRFTIDIERRAIVHIEKLN